MAKKYKCPVCGFTSDNKQAVRGHILGSSDPEHRALRGPGLWDRIIEIDDDQHLELENQVNEELQPERSVEINIANDDTDLLKLVERLTNNTELNNLKEEVESLKERIEKIERKLEVHKLVMIKILKALGVE